MQDCFYILQVKNMFGANDPFSTTLRSHVVYKFTCTGCDASYMSVRPD